MRDETDDRTARPSQNGDLIDVTRMPIPQLLSSDDTVLDNAVRRLLAEMDAPQEIVSGFSSYVERSPSA